VRIGDKDYPHSATASGNATLFTVKQTIEIEEGEELRIEAAV
jgi:hypothetical protein